MRKEPGEKIQVLDWKEHILGYLPPPKTPCCLIIYLSTLGCMGLCRRAGFLQLQPAGVMLQVQPAGFASQWLLDAEQGLQNSQASAAVACGSVAAAPGLSSAGSIAVVHGLSCSEACGIFSDQQSNHHLLPWQVDSLPSSHQGSPQNTNLKKHLHPNVHSNIIYNCQNMETT